MKLCCKCEKNKERVCFSKDSRSKDGLCGSCKGCNGLYKKENYSKNRKHITQAKRERYKTNKSEFLKKRKEYYEKNKEKENEATRAYYLSNKILLNSKNAKYTKNKRKNNIQYRLACNLRARLRMAIKNDQKMGSAIKDLGCPVSELKIYLESKFKDGMTWENYGNKKNQWSIDHVIPLSKVDLSNREEFLKVSHFSNLQPMWHSLNIKKGNKYP